MLPEKTVFISYRRSISKYAAKVIFDFLRSRSFDVFYDISSIDNGDFEDAILDNIAARIHFVVLLTPETLRRCLHDDGSPNPDDWLRREIEFAIEHQRNVVPVLMDDFNFGEATTYLTGTLENLSRYNACPIYYEYMDEGLNRLAERYLKPPTFPVKIVPLTAQQAQTSNERMQQASTIPAPAREELIAEQQVSVGKLYDVFLSYCRQDMDWMKRIRASLEHAGLSVWVDEQALSEVPNPVIDRAQVLVAVMTPRYKKEEFADGELIYAREHQKLIAPILVEGNPSTSIPTRLAVYQYADSTRNYREGIQKLVNIIQKV